MMTGRRLAPPFGGDSARAGACITALVRPGTATMLMSSMLLSETGMPAELVQVAELVLSGIEQIASAYRDDSVPLVTVATYSRARFIA